MASAASLSFPNTLILWVGDESLLPPSPTTHVVDIPVDPSPALIAHDIDATIASSLSSPSPPPSTAVILALPDQELVCELTSILQAEHPTLFRIVWWPFQGPSPPPHLRLHLARNGANMVTADHAALTHVLTLLDGKAAPTLANNNKSKKNKKNKGKNKKNKSESATTEGMVCPFCGLEGLDATSMWYHVPLFHVVEPNSACTLSPQGCPICSATEFRKPWPVHLFEDHYPEQLGPCHDGAGAVPLYSFALVVIQREEDGALLLVQEFDNKGFWLPGGRIDPGEDIRAAAIRETKEEAGVDVKLTGVLRMEYAPRSRYVRMRVIFLGQLEPSSPLPKTVPDYESAGAAWCTLEEMQTLSLRGPEPLIWGSYLAKGGHVSPIDILASGESNLPPGVTQDDILAYYT